jgi:hypothetical protein
MKGRSAIIGVVIGAVVLLLLYYFYTNFPSNRYNWGPSLESSSDQPYGTMFIRKMLESYRSDAEFVINDKQTFHKLYEEGDYSDGNTDYVLIGQSIHLDSADLDAMMKFMWEGNDVFIATVDVPRKLLELVYEDACEGEVSYHYFRDTTLTANFYHPAFQKNTDYEFSFRQGTENAEYFWRSLDPHDVCNSWRGISPLGYQYGDRVNFLRMDEGKGHLYVHTVPLLFTNYFMTQPDKMEYASAVFSHLSGNNIIWDEISKMPFVDVENPYNSPLYYIMQQPALKAAWWMLIAAAILYIIFASKRTQRIIPVLEVKSNTSLEFLNVISSLHYQNPNHLDIARKKMKYFLYFIRARYGINTQSFTEEHVKRLAERSKVDIADIQVIYDRYKVIESYSISNDESDRLVGLYQAIDKFYKNCK